MARMPLDPKISRMLLEARGEGCLREVAVIAAVLSIALVASLALPPTVLAERFRLSGGKLLYYDEDAGGTVTVHEPPDATVPPV